jgi:hypothetical protein
VQTAELTAEGLRLLARNSEHMRRVDFPAGLRCHALNLSVHIEGPSFGGSDEAALRERVISRAVLFEAYLRDGAS